MPTKLEYSPKRACPSTIDQEHCSSYKPGNCTVEELNKVQTRVSGVTKTRRDMFVFIEGCILQEA